MNKRASSWFTETIYADHAMSFKIEKILLPETDTGFQKLAVFHNKTLGNVMVLDGAIQLAELDEHIYHETMSHTGVIAAEQVTSALIVGGGDCGIARELLKYKSIDEIYIVDIDPMVTSASKKYFQKVTRGVIGNKRLHILHEDGTKINELFGSKKFDLIILDTTDENETSISIFTKDFLKRVQKQLTPCGVMMRLGGSVFYQKKELKRIAQDIKQVFGAKNIGCITFSGAATYYGGPFCLFIAKNTETLRTAVPDKFFENKQIKNKYFSSSTYKHGIVTGWEGVKKVIQ